MKEYFFEVAHQYYLDNNTKYFSSKSFLNLSIALQQVKSVSCIQKIHVFTFTKFTDLHTEISFLCRNSYFLGVSSIFTCHRGGFVQGIVTQTFFIISLFVRITF